MKVGLALAALALAVAVTPAGAQAAPCSGITNAKQRLICQTQARRGYGTGLEHALTERGFDANVYVEEAGDPGSGAYPRLVIWTSVANDRPYELNTQEKILEGARRVGFRMIVYVDKGEDKNWYFDLTRPGPAALDVVPWQTPPWRHKAEQP